jgi:hypothetical protein
MILDFEPTIDDLRRCHEIETEYSNTDRYGAEDGFFIKVEPIDIYMRLRESGDVLVVKDGKDVVGFTLMIPPGDHIMKRLFNSGCLDWFIDNSFQEDNSAWIAKVAVIESRKRNNIAKKMLIKIKEKYDGFSILTTTALYPVRNKAIEATLKSVDMNRMGVYVSSVGVNTLWGV